MAASLITSWDSLGTGDNAKLSSGGSGENSYFTFNGITIENTGNLGENKNVTIGIYQTTDSVYAFASTKMGENDSIPSKASIGGEGNNATLIASGSGKIEDGGQVSGIAITLQDGESIDDLKKLGFNGEAITNITGSDKGDTVYIIKGENETNSISTKAKLDFSQGGNDTAFFTGKSSVSMILGGG